MKLSAKQLEWTLYAPKLIPACISNPSESVWNFSWLRVSVAIQAYEVKAQYGTECQHPEWTSYAPRTCRHAFRIRSSQCETSVDMCRWHHEIHANEIESQNETKRQTPRMYFLSALAHQSTHSKFVWVGAKASPIMCFDRYRTSMSKKPTHETKRDSKRPELTTMCSGPFQRAFQSFRVGVKSTTS